MKYLFCLFLVKSVIGFSQSNSFESNKDQRNYKWSLEGDLNYLLYGYMGLEQFGGEIEIERSLFRKSKIEICAGLGYYLSENIKSIPISISIYSTSSSSLIPFFELKYPLLRNLNFPKDDVDITNLLFNSSVGFRYFLNRSYITVSAGAWFIQRTDFQYPYDTGPVSIGLLPLLEVGYGWKF